MGMKMNFLPLTVLLLGSAVNGLWDRMSQERALRRNSVFSKRRSVPGGLFHAARVARLRHRRRLVIKEADKRTAVLSNGSSCSKSTSDASSDSSTSSSDNEKDGRATKEPKTQEDVPNQQTQSAPRSL